MLRLLASTLLAASVVLACSPPPTPTHSPSAASPEPTTVRTPAPTTVPTPAASPTPTEAAADRYPVELVGRLLVFPAADGHRTIFRIGHPETFTVPRGTQLLGVIGDHVVTATPDATGSTLRIWSFETGAQVGTETYLPDYVNPRPSVAGTDIVISSEIDAVGHDLGLVAFSTADASVRILVDASSVTGLGSPERVVAVSESGAVVATSVCATGIDFVADCRPTQLLDVASGKLVRAIDVGGQLVTTLADDWILAGDIGESRIIDAQGREVWSTAPIGSGATIWSRRVEPDGRLFAEIRDLSGDVAPRLIAVDPRTGRQTRLYRPETDRDWTWYPELSTDRLLAIGSFQERPCIFAGACGPDDSRTVEAAILDVVTGTFTPNAMRITFPP